MVTAVIAALGTGWQETVMGARCVGAAFPQCDRSGLGHEARRFFYTLDWDNRPLLRQKLWWPMCEAIGACTFLAKHFDDPIYEEWYRRFWGLCNNRFIDHRLGGWRHELTEDLGPGTSLFK